MSPPRIPLKLAAEWEAKLAKEGLQDLENSQGQLKTWHSFHFHHSSTNHDFEHKQAYFRFAEHFLNSHKFKHKYHKDIWALYSEATAEREIAKKVGRGRRKVREILAHLKEEMKKWIDAERNRIDDDDINF